MLEKTKGIVFHTTNYSETSIVVKVYTRQYGLQAYLVSGVRKQKSKINRNLFQPLTQVELVAYHKKSPGLKRIKDIQCDLPYQSIPFDTSKSVTVIFLAEILYRAIKEEECNTDLFDYIAHALHIFDIRHQNFSSFHIYFIAGLTKHLGFYPDINQYKPGYVFDLAEGVFINSDSPKNDCMDANSTSVFVELLRSSFETFFLIGINASERKSLLESLTRYYELHLTHHAKIKSKEVLHEIFL